MRFTIFKSNYRALLTVCSLAKSTPYRTHLPEAYGMKISLLQSHITFGPKLSSRPDSRIEPPLSPEVVGKHSVAKTLLSR